MSPDEIVRKILEFRGIVAEEDVREFLSHKPKLTHEPALMPGMSEAAAFLQDALTLGRHICVYGDYDVDGICGTALLVQFLREAARAFGGGAEITYYIPSRIEEGYGLNEGAVRTVWERGADVIVTVDCGSVSSFEAAYAKALGMDILITDHHDLDTDSMPDCIVVNPKIKPAGGGGYPFEKLSGAGVAFKLCSALLDRMGDGEGSPGCGLRALLHDLVDLVCVATIADVMPLVDENRTFVKYGLSMLRKGSRRAFRTLLKVAHISPEKLSVRDVAFGIAPRINAIGRLADAEEGVEFLLTKDENRMWGTARRMEKCNMERRKLQDECFVECMALYEKELNEGGEGAGARFLLLRPKSSHEGVAGIVASKVREATGMPCAVLTETKDGEELLKGSARSGGRLDMIALLRKHNRYFLRLGGHSAAAGFVIDKNNEDVLRETLSGEVAAMAEQDPELLLEREESELEIEAADVSPGLAEAIEGMAPFGAGNRKPRLTLRVAAELIAFARIIGQDGKHLRFNADSVPCVFFNGANTRLPSSGSVSIVGCPEMNEWNRVREIQFAVKQVNVLL